MMKKIFSFFPGRGCMKNTLPLLVKNKIIKKAIFSGEVNISSISDKITSSSLLINLL
jgi:hypothetical protein